MSDAQRHGVARAEQDDALRRPRREQIGKYPQHAGVLGDRLSVLEDEERILLARLPGFEQGSIPGREIRAGGVQPQADERDRFAGLRLGG